MTSFPSSHFSVPFGSLARPNFGCGSFTREDVFFQGDKLSGGLGWLGFLPKFCMELCSVRIAGIYDTVFFVVGVALI